MVWIILVAQLFTKALKRFSEFVATTFVGTIPPEIISRRILYEFSVSSSKEHGLQVRVLDEFESQRDFHLFYVDLSPVGTDPFLVPVRLVESEHGPFTTIPDTFRDVRMVINELE